MLISKNIEAQRMMGTPFDYHWRCQKTGLTHLCFADDLLLFCGGSLSSGKILHKALHEFYSLSGLLPNTGKSSVFVVGRHSRFLEAVHARFQFQGGERPVRYLGVPLHSTKLTVLNCKPLVDRIISRVSSWTVRFLSFDGLLQLIKYVLCGIQSFYNGLFILPKAVIRKVEQILRQFLWIGPQLGTRGTKVAWEDLSLPTKEGGLGIKKLDEWNIAVMSKHLWNLCHPMATSSWAIWARVNHLRGHSLWDISIPTSSSWTWRKVLQLRSIYRPLIKYLIGDGRHTSLWFDNWLPSGPIH